MIPGSNLTLGMQQYFFFFFRVCSLFRFHKPREISLYSCARAEDTKFTQDIDNSRFIELLYQSHVQVTNK